jgi:hypothetical protein
LFKFNSSKICAKDHILTLSLISDSQFKDFKSHKIVFKRVVLPVQFAQIIHIFSDLCISISSGSVINFLL